MADPKAILPYVLLVYLLRLYLRRRRSLLIAPENFVSRQALQLIKIPEPSPHVLQSVNLQNPYDALKNPDGIIDMASDENHLCVDLINARLKSIGANPTSTAITKINQLQQDHGIPALRNAVGGYISRFTATNVSLEPSRMVITAGAAAAIEILSFCVADAKRDAILVPSPYNPCYDKCIGWRSGVEIVQIPCRSSDDFQITPTALARGLRTCKFRRLKPRALLISNPSNPTGYFMHRETLLMLLKFAVEKQIHVICDETHAASLQSYPDEFTSIVDISENNDRVHVVYDVGIPGFEVGVIYSYNERVLEAAKEYARGCPVSGDAQSLVAAVLSDSNFVEEYVSENRRRVRDRFLEFYTGLERAGVRCAASGGGAFCWVQMERVMGAYSEKGEAELWKELLKEGGIYGTRGSEWHCIEPGWFRLCFGSLTAEEAAVALRRVRDFVRRRRQIQRQVDCSVV